LAFESCLLKAKMATYTSLSLPMIYPLNPLTT